VHLDFFALAVGVLRGDLPNFARFSSLLGCISDEHSSKTKIVVRALAICVCFLFAAGAAQTATALTMSIKIARGGLEVGAIWTPVKSILRRKRLF
jgi:hypothetical protein